jgi:DNA invertase Pin-like site-specific DNA recombinase
MVSFYVIVISNKHIGGIIMAGIKIGIGRVSTKEQNEARQIEAFKQEGIEDRYIFMDKCSGNAGNLDKREDYQRARAIVREGDTVYLDALDRLGRNTEEIKREWRYFTEEVGCYMVVLNMPLLDTRPKDGPVDTSSLIQNIVFEIFSWMAQKETEERKRRQREGIEIAKREGKYKGRKPVEVNPHEFALLLAEVRSGERTNKYVMDKLGLTRTTYYKLVGEFDTKTGRFEE